MQRIDGGMETSCEEITRLVDAEKFNLVLSLGETLHVALT